MTELQNLLSFLPEKWRGLVAALLCVSPLITRAVYSLMQGGGLRGIFKAIWLGTNTPKPSDTLPASPGSQAGAHNPIPLPLLACLVAPALLFVGCRSLAPGGVYKGDALAYEADKAIVMGYEVLHDFVTWERDNRPAFANEPGVKRAADYVRANARQWLQTAIAARDAYTAAPGPETRDALNRSLAVLRAALVEAVKYLNQTKP